MTKDQRAAHRRRTKTIAGIVSQMRVAQLDARGVYDAAVPDIPDTPFVTRLPHPNFGVWRGGC